MLFSLLAGCLTVGAAEKKTSPDSLPSPTSAMLRSLAIPGWGQWHNGKKFKAAVLAGGEIGLIADAVVLNQLAAAAQTEIDRAYYRDNRSLAIWWLAGVLLYSLADAYVDAHLAGFDESPDLTSAQAAMPLKAWLQQPPAMAIKISFALGG
jgi:hypothetical protein